MASNIDDLLQNDDGVESLTDWEVKDVWVRMNMAKKASEKFIRSDSHNLDKIEKNLQNYHSGYLLQLAADIFGDNSRAVHCLNASDDKLNIDRLFDEWTVDSVDGDVTVIQASRQKIKSTLRGCGMSRMKVARGRVSYHND